MRTQLWLVLLSGVVLSAKAAFGEFDAENRSINGTGETLRANKCEVGLGALACGLTDNLQLSAPTLSLLTGSSDGELRYKWALPNDLRIAPAVIFGTPLHFGGRLDFGIDFGAEKAHSFTLTVESDWANRRDLPLKKYGPDKAYRFTSYIGGEYDFYVWGDVFYVGLSKQVPYLGYTLAFTRFHCGLITSSRSKFIPVPYVYWRF